MKSHETNAQRMLYSVLYVHSSMSAKSLHATDMFMQSVRCCVPCKLARYVQADIYVYAHSRRSKPKLLVTIVVTTKDTLLLQLETPCLGS